ncbi:MAG: hypothetical protein PHN75_04845 [Syntrophales bacterium]|nr:hypothetical protein [Syntrophales bacterium]
MADENGHKEAKEKLFYGGVIFGITATIAFFVAVHFASRIEFDRDHSSFLMNILLWIVEWLVILGAVALPWIVWKKMVKPYKDF